MGIEDLRAKHPWRKTVFMDLSVTELQHLFYFSIQAIEESLRSMKYEDITWDQVLRWKSTLHIIERIVQKPEFEEGLYLFSSNPVYSLTPQDYLDRIKPLKEMVFNLSASKGPKRDDD